MKHERKREEEKKGGKRGLTAIPHDLLFVIFVRETYQRREGQTYIKNNQNYVQLDVGVGETVEVHGKKLFGLHNRDLEDVLCLLFARAEPHGDFSLQYVMYVWTH